MTGTELLAEAIPLQPDAKRVLLTAYADTDVAIRAINEIRLDQYLLKPWEPPEERLYPVVDDLLADWTAGFRPPFEGLRLLSSRWAPRGHELRDFLTRNQVPYAWLDPEADEEGRRLAASLDPPVDPTQPVVCFADGRILRDPSTRELAEAVGMSVAAALPVLRSRHRRRRPGRAWPPRCTARARACKTLLIEREAPGRAGRHHEPHRELPRLPVRPDRQRPGAARADAGPAAGCRDPARRRRWPRSSRGPVPDRRARRRQRAQLPGGGRGHRCQLPAARRSPARRSSPGAGVYYGAATTEAVLYRDAEVAVIGAGNSAGQAAVAPVAVRPARPPRHSRR